MELWQIKTHVNGYTRRDGTQVSGYDRSSPGSHGAGLPADVGLILLFVVAVVVVVIWIVKLINSSSTSHSYSPSYSGEASPGTAPARRSTTKRARHDMATSPKPVAEVSPPAPPTEQEIFDECLLRVARLKTADARQRAAAQGLERITSETLRNEFQMRVARLDVTAVLGKVAELKTLSAKRKNLEAAIERLKNDDVDDELQVRELAVLEEALGSLSGPTAKIDDGKSSGATKAKESNGESDTSS